MSAPGRGALSGRRRAPTVSYNQDCRTRLQRWESFPAARIVAPGLDPSAFDGI